MRAGIRAGPGRVRDGQDVRHNVIRNEARAGGEQAGRARRGGTRAGGQGGRAAFVGDTRREGGLAGPGGASGVATYRVTRV